MSAKASASASHARRDQPIARESRSALGSSSPPLAWKRKQIAPVLQANVPWKALVSQPESWYLSCFSKSVLIEGLWNKLHILPWIKFDSLLLQADAESRDCQNGCCTNQGQHCLNGGTCHETCDVTMERFTCSCKSCFGGKYCETRKQWFLNKRFYK